MGDILNKMYRIAHIKYEHDHCALSYTRRLTFTKITVLSFKLMSPSKICHILKIMFCSLKFFVITKSCILMFSYNGLIFFLCKNH